MLSNKLCAIWQQLELLFQLLYLTKLWTASLQIDGQLGKTFSFRKFTSSETGLLWIHKLLFYGRVHSTTA